MTAAAHTWPLTALQAAWEQMIYPDWGPVLVQTAEAIAATGGFVWPDPGPPPSLRIYVGVWGMVYPYPEAVTVRIVAIDGELAIDDVEFGRP